MPTYNLNAGALFPPKVLHDSKHSWEGNLNISKDLLHYMLKEYPNSDRITMYVVGWEKLTQDGRYLPYITLKVHPARPNTSEKPNE
jgi:hypothetical protein